MSVGRHAARRAKRTAEEAAVLAKKNEETINKDLAKAKERSQKLFIRRARASSAGGMFYRSDAETLG